MEASFASYEDGKNYMVYHILNLKKVVKKIYVEKAQLSFRKQSPDLSHRLHNVTFLVLY